VLEENREIVDELAEHVTTAHDYLISGRTYDTQCELKGAIGALYSFRRQRVTFANARSNDEDV
jgi:hypothetical protein